MGACTGSLQHRNGGVNNRTNRVSGVKISLNAKKSVGVTIANSEAHLETADRRFKMKWWGWGAETVRASLSQSPATLDYLRSRFGLERLEAPSALRLESVRLPESRLDPSSRERLAAIVGPANCRFDQRERVLHSVGKGYKDLVRLRQLTLDQATDVVVYPRGEEEVVAILACCRELNLALVPFGGGTSVVGGLEAEAGGRRLVVTLDLAYLSRVIEIDAVSQTAIVEAGIFGPALEQQLAARGFTLGHFPQSFEFSTLGGWIATRSSGQNSLSYGGIDKLVESLRIVTPEGTIETLHVPRRGDGPDLTQMLIGSEGAYGIIVSATVRIRPKPESRDYWMYAFKDFGAAIDASRTLVQTGSRPALLRIADEEETTASLALGHRPGHGRRSIKRRFGQWLLTRKGFRPPHMVTLLVGLEGSADQVRRERRIVRRHFSKFNCLSLGASFGQRWLATRFELPYLRDELLDNHLLVDTLETATTWSALRDLYRTVRTAIESAAKEQGEPIIVFTHVSHLYADGASLYFSLLGRQKRSDPIGQWWAIKRAAGEAIRAQGAVISHHHGVGMDHRAQTGWSPIERQMLMQLKQTLDPTGIMNPGKLL
jgi:alkyldihydroxyacetonephosphate synthase